MFSHGQWVINCSVLKLLVLWDVLCHVAVELDVFSFQHRRLQAPLKGDGRQGR